MINNVQYFEVHWVRTTASIDNNVIIIIPQARKISLKIVYTYIITLRIKQHIIRTYCFTPNTYIPHNIVYTYTRSDLIPKRILKL